MSREDGRESREGRSARVARRRRPGFTRGLAVAGRQLSPRPSDAGCGRGGCRARHPGDRPLAVPAVSRCRARQHHDQAVNVAPRGAPIAVRMSRSAGRNDAAHCPGWPPSLNGAPHPADAGRACGAPLTPETSASPAGLTARARPQARPGTRAANLPRVSDARFRVMSLRRPGSRARSQVATPEVLSGSSRRGRWPGT